MTQLLFANNASTTLSGPITNVATTLSLTAGAGALFPNPSAGQAFTATLTDAATGLLNEIISCTARTVDTLTVVRAQEGTVALSWLAGDLFNQLWTAGQAAAMQQSSLLTPARIITASGVFTMLTTDAGGAVGLNRTAAPSTSSTTLPTGATAGQLYAVEDLAGNFNQYQVTVAYPAGHTGPEGATQQILNVNRQCSYFRYYGSSTWSWKT
jgi:hypothetical protein